MSRREIEGEVDRLSRRGLASMGYGEAELERLAELVLRVREWKARRGAVIPAHVYQRAEVLAAADFTGDSYKLAKLCSRDPAGRIVFCGVRFMAETAKVLNPGKEVYLSAPEAGCSLADSISALDVRRLKAAHPGAPVACYINTTCGVKAECDVVVTSANASRILRRLYERSPKVLFLPDEWMGRNLARELGKRVGREMVVWNGKCEVHERFDAGSVRALRRAYPGVKVLVHAECSPALARGADFVGGTGDMMRFVRETDAPHYMLVTECGLGELARGELPEKSFVPMCRLCPHMKRTDLGAVLRVLEGLPRECVVEVDPASAGGARRALERMFELAEGP